MTSEQGYTWRLVRAKRDWVPEWLFRAFARVRLFGFSLALYHPFNVILTRKVTDDEG